MLDGRLSGCINHPGIEAVFRCKQCAKPVCRTCVVQGPRGHFCSQICADKFEAFAQRAEALDVKQKGAGFFRLKRALFKLAVLTAVLAGIGVAASRMNIPFLSDIVWQIRAMLGI